VIAIDRMLCYLSSVRFDFQELYRAIDDKRRLRGLTWQDVANEIGQDRPGPRISASTITRTAKGGSMEADGVLAMIRWLGQTFQCYTRGAVVSTNSLPMEAPGMGRFDAKAFYKALDEKRQTRKMTWQ